MLKTTLSENKYLYNGKELQDEQLGGVNLDWYDYGSRYYDPALARFHTIDPKAETFKFQSPYTYAANNPILFIDENGEGPGISPYFFIGARFYLEDKVGSFMRLLTNDYSTNASVPARTQQIRTNIQKTNDIHNVATGVRDIGLSYAAIAGLTTVTVGYGGAITAGMLAGTETITAGARQALMVAYRAGQIPEEVIYYLATKNPILYGYLYTALNTLAPGGIVTPQTDDYVETDVQLIYLLWQTLLNNTNLKPKEPQPETEPEPEPEPEPDEEENDK